MKIKFKEISLSASKQGKCVNCGKTAKRTKKFWQTISPFNKNKSGYVKTSEEIYKELRIDIAKWKKEHIAHAKCSYPKGNEPPPNDIGSYPAV